MAALRFCSSSLFSVAAHSPDWSKGKVNGAMMTRAIIHW
jgi:hypothetical protein